MSSYVRAGVGRRDLSGYYKPDPRWPKPSRRVRKVKKLGYTPTSRWDGMTRPKKALVKTAGVLAGLGALGGVLGGLLGKKKKSQKGSGRKCRCRKNR